MDTLCNCNLKILMNWLHPSKEPGFLPHKLSAGYRGLTRFGIELYDAIFIYRSIISKQSGSKRTICYFSFFPFHLWFLYFFLSSLLKYPPFFPIYYISFNQILLNCLYHYFILEVISHHNIVPAGDQGLYNACRRNPII